MRIAIMLRHLGQHGGGVLVYTRSLLDHLLALEGDHEFVLLYQDPAHMGSYAGRDRVTERVSEHRSRLGWDQVAVPAMLKATGADVLFNPKYSLPLVSSVPGVFVCHGLDWYVMPTGSRWTDRLSHRLLIPRYAKKADRIIAVSDTARNHVLEFLGLPEERVETVHLGVDPRFHLTPTEGAREAARERFGLPERYFFYCGQIYPPKNFGRLVRAFARVGPPNGYSLVVAGTHTWLSEHEVALIDELDLRTWVVETGWVDRDTLPVLYDLASALIMPSLYEACPSPILEAMAMGCPIVTADRYGTAELAGPAAVLVDPEDVEAIAAGMLKVLEDDALRARIVNAGKERVRRFTWQEAASRTLAVIEQAAHARSGQKTR